VMTIKARATVTSKTETVMARIVVVAIAKTAVAMAKTAVLMAKIAVLMAQAATVTMLRRKRECIRKNACGQKDVGGGIPLVHDNAFTGCLPMECCYCENKEGYNMVTRMMNLAMHNCAHHYPMMANVECQKHLLVALPCHLFIIQMDVSWFTCGPLTLKVFFHCV